MLAKYLCLCDFRIDCPYIVQFIGVSWYRPTDMMLVTEYMSNGDLRNYLRNTNSNSFSWKQKIEFALSISEGLVYIHSLDPKIIHRDLKSANVLLDEDMQAKITDFGVSRETNDATMTAGIGTYRWMAPEVLMGKYYSESADIFSLGAILSELDTHDIPFGGLVNSNGKPFADTTILTQVVNGNLRPSFTDTCPRVILDLATACLAFNSEERPRASEVPYQLRTALKKM